MISEVYEKNIDEIIEDGDIVFITEDGKVSKPETVTDCKKVIGVCVEHSYIEVNPELYSEEVKCMVGILGKLNVKTDQTFLMCGDIVKAVPGGVRKVQNISTDLPFILGKVVEPYKNGKVKINLKMCM